jgi:hypothetical protein
VELVANELAGFHDELEVAAARSQPLENRLDEIVFEMPHIALAQ